MICSSTCSRGPEDPEVTFVKKPASLVPVKVLKGSSSRAGRCGCKPASHFTVDDLNSGVALVAVPTVEGARRKRCDVCKAGGRGLIALGTGAHAGDVLAVGAMRRVVDLVPVQRSTLTPFEAGMP